MTSSQVGFASSLLNRSSTLTTTTLLKKNNNGYLHSRFASTTNSESENLKTQKAVDLSWLPNHDDNNSAHESHHHHHNGQDYFDDSWLPDHIVTKGKASRIASKSFKSNRSQKTEKDSDNSSLPTTSDVTKGNQNKKSQNKVHWKRAQEVVFSGDKQIQPLNKKPESSNSPGQVSPNSENSVETDSLGGVSTLLRRWKDLHETKNTNGRSKSFSGNNNHPSGSPAKVFDASEKTAPPSTTAASVVHPESGKKSLSRTISCPISKAGDVEKEKIRVTDIIKKQEEKAASQAAGNTNEIFSKICNSWDQQQVAGETKGFSPAKSKTHLIRGRHAINDFLNLMKQDKLRELENLANRKPVSQFPHRGRIRALLRFRFMRIEAESKRESKIDNHKLSVSRTNDRRDEEVKATNSLQELESITTTNQSAQEGKDDPEITEFLSPVKEIMDEEAYDSDSSFHSIRSEESIYSDMISDEKELDDFIQLENSHDGISDEKGLHDSFQLEKSHDRISEEKGLHDSIQLENSLDWISDKKGFHDSIQLENPHNWISEYSQSPNDWDEEEEESWNTQSYDENLYWITDIARPRSHWECMRQARYREMLHLCSYKQDIRELLERRCVASFLSSDMRDKMDQLMVNQAQAVWQSES